MLNFFNKLVNAGNQRGAQPEKRKWIRLSNISALLALLGFWINGLAFIFVGSYTLGSLCLLVAFAQLGLLFLNQQGVYQINWVMYQFINVFFIFYFSTTIGNQAPVYWYYLISLKTGLMYFFGYRYRWLKRGLLAFILLLMGSDLMLGIRPFGTHILKPASLDFFAVFEPGLCFAMLILFIYYFVNETHNYSRKMDQQAKNIQEKNHELEKLNEELDRLVYHAWHDLRAPIASAMGLINLARQETSMEVVQQYLHLQDKSLKKLDKLIRDLLDYKRNREIAIKHEAVDFQQKVQEALSACRCEGGNCKVDCEVIIDQQGTFVTDTARLDMILKNLISNAIQYSKPEDLKPHIRVEIKTDGQEARISVSDDGIGIRQDLHERIFDMFYRASNQSEGTGLGLYIVNETTRKLGGEITVESAPGEGSTFRVAIPNLEPDLHHEIPVLAPKIPQALREIA